ncbi:hypothetical protein IMG5_085090, partial [Ichthyophthirius multifiliis]
LLIIIQLSQQTYFQKNNKQQNEDCSCLEQKYLLPEPFRVKGQASKTLNDTSFVVQFTLETLEKTATKSLQINNEIITEVQKQLKKIQKLVISTSEFSVQPKYKYVYDKQTQQDNQIFEGYKVTNSIQVQSDQIELAGQVIDIGISNGMTAVDFVQFTPNQQNIKDSQQSLIESAIQNSQFKAESALKAINHKILSIKSIEIVEDNKYTQPQKSDRNNRAYSASEADSAVSTQLSGSQSKIEVQVYVTFIIEKN